MAGSTFSYLTKPLALEVPVPGTQIVNEGSFNTIGAGNPVVTPFTMTITGIANVQDIDNPVNTVLVLKRSREETKPHRE